jgi:quinoprotein glucose dehydrogenase
MLPVDEAPKSNPKLVWPWFVLATFVVAVLLAILWVSAEVRRVERFRYIGMPPATRPVTNALAPYRDLLAGGDAGAGRKVFFEKPEANCGKCHQVGGSGGDVGPALDDIGARQTREQILESIIFPNVQTSEGYQSVILLLKNGDAASGVLKRESATELVVNSADEGVRTVKVADVQSRRNAVSPMPEGLWLVLSRPELRDLVAYLAALK